jgi:beta-lactamase superfamily II metal-dependent hydrolase
MKTEKLSNNVISIDSQIIFSVNNIIDRIFSKRKVQKILQKYNVKEYNISNYFTRIEYLPEKVVKRGRMIEMNGLPFNTIIKIAEEVCKEFKENNVTVKDFNTNRILFVNSIEKEKENK